jgi:hypothetical protein
METSHGLLTEIAPPSIRIGACPEFSTDLDMDGPIGVVGFLFALALGVVMMGCDGFEMSCPFVFGVQGVIQAHLEGPMVALVGRVHQVLHDKVTERRPEVFGRPRADAQRVRPMRRVRGVDNESRDPGKGFLPCF